ncbi:MAG: hypothetical protein AAF562_14805 [Pseudomonadota bacterium]
MIKLRSVRAWVTGSAVLVLSGGLAFGVATISGWKADRDRLQAELAVQTRNVAALTLEAERAREARAVAQASRERAESIARAADAARERLLREIADVPIADDLCRVLRDLGELCSEPKAN